MSILARLLAKPFEQILGHTLLQPISSAVARFGLHCVGINLHYELKDSGELRFLQKVNKSIPGFICFDVGANVGEYALAALEAGASKVVCFEPVSPTFEELRQALNGRGATLKNIGLGEKSGNVSLYLPEGASSTLASRDAQLLGSQDNLQRFDVRIETIDEVVEQLGSYPDLLKIDVEGFELEVLLGGKKLLSGTRRPRFIQFEFNIHHMYRGQTIDNFIEILSGYDLYRLTQTGVSPIGVSPALDRLYGYMNIVATTEKIN